MPKSRKRDAKDPATKGTLNPPDAEKKAHAAERELEQRQGERQVGNYSGAGTPPLQKR